MSSSDMHTHMFSELVQFYLSLTHENCQLTHIAPTPSRVPLLGPVLQTVMGCPQVSYFVTGLNSC